MKSYKISVNGQSYDVTVEEVGSAAAMTATSCRSAAGAAPGASEAAASCAARSLLPAARPARETTTIATAAMATTMMPDMPAAYTGMLPCLRLGRVSRLPRSMARAAVRRALVCAGSMTSST